MMRVAAPMLVALAIVSQVSAQSQDLLARFDGGIGVTPLLNAAGPANPDGTFANVTQNVVRGVGPGGAAWVIRALKAEIDINGGIHVRGRGLLLAAGNSIGQNGNQRVFATLICEATTPFVEHNTSTDGVALAADGDFRIDDTLNPPPPTECASPVLLIRNTRGAWFAAGIPKLEDR